LLIFACSSDKDVPGIVQILGQHFAHAYLTRYTQSRRGVPPEQLLELWRRSSSKPATACATPVEAWHAVRAAAAPNDLICVAGSVFLAGELRAEVCS